MTLTRRLSLAAAAVAAALPFVVSGAPAQAAAPPAISAKSLGLHFLNHSHPWPSVGFGSARIWDMGVTWRELQPSKGKTRTSTLHALDGIIDRYRAAGVEPVYTLGMTPAWAARHCNHKKYGQDWGARTCAPASMSSWTSYVRMIASRYQGKVKYFELWNEPSLANGWNDSVARLAALAKAALPIVHRYHAQLIAPSIPFTDGGPTHGLQYLDQYLSEPGGKSFDIIGFHLYPTDPIAKAGYGPEWTISVLNQAWQVLHRHHVSGKHVWNTEVNVGRTYSHTTFTGWAGAAQVARTFILATQNHIQRTFWYAFDDRGWGGTWMLRSDYKTLAMPGAAYRTVYKLLVGARPYGCSRTTVGTHKWHYTCRFRLKDGQAMRVVWSTGSAFSYRVPAGTKHVYDAIGHGRRIGTLKVGSAPYYVTGTFKL